MFHPAGADSMAQFYQYPRMLKGGPRPALESVYEAPLEVEHQGRPHHEGHPLRGSRFAEDKGSHKNHATRLRDAIPAEDAEQANERVLNRCELSTRHTAGV